MCFANDLRFPVHRSKSVMEFAIRHKENIVFLYWPKSFGDVMPVETVWCQILNEFNKENVKATNEDSLWREVSMMWRKVCTEEYVNQLLQQIPLKLQKVVQCGGSTYVD